MGRSIPKRRKYNRNYKKIFNVGKVSMGALSLIIFLMVTVLFLIQSNRVAVKGYNISELESKISLLEQQNADFKLEASKLQSIQVIKEGIKDDKMTPVKKINYIRENNEVALRK